MRLWPLIAALLLHSACASGPKPSDVILSRPDAPLLDVTVGFQRMYRTSEGGTDLLDLPTMERRLVVTPTEFTMPGGNGNQLTPWEFTLSFSIVESVEVKSIHYDPFGIMSSGSSMEGAVVITDQRGICWNACVIRFVDADGNTDLALAERFVEIVRQGRSAADPFGRTDGPRTVALAAGLRSPRPSWRRDIRDAPKATREEAGDIERQATDYAADSLRTDYRRCLVRGLNDRLGGWSFQAIDQVGVKRNTELDVSSVLRSEALESMGSNSMLVSDIYGLGLIYIPSFEDQPARVETLFRAYVDFYDLSPMKDGRYFWFDFTQQRIFAEFARDPAAAIREDSERMCEALTVRIAEEFARPGTGNRMTP